MEASINGGGGYDANTARDSALVWSSRTLPGRTPPSTSQGSDPCFARRSHRETVSMRSDSIRRMVRIIREVGSEGANPRVTPRIDL